LTTGLNIAVRLDAPPDLAAHRRSSVHRLRPFFALLGLVLIAVAALFGIASSSQIEQPDALLLFSCGPCHD
jgi:hypothetical protein